MRRNRNPGVDTQKLMLNGVLVAGGIYVVGAMNLYPPPVQETWNRFFNKGKSLGPSVWDRGSGGTVTPTPPVAHHPPPALPPPSPGGTVPAPPAKPPTTPSAPAVWVEAWPDARETGSHEYDYPVGGVVTFYGRVVLSQGSPLGRSVYFVDPDANGGQGQHWLDTATDGQGGFHISYEGHDTAPWRSYVVDNASGARSAVMTLTPYAQRGESLGNGGGN